MGGEQVGWGAWAPLAGRAPAAPVLLSSPPPDPVTVSGLRRLQTSPDRGSAALASTCPPAPHLQPAPCGWPGHLDSGCGQGVSTWMTLSRASLCQPPAWQALGRRGGREMKKSTPDSALGMLREGLKRPQPCPQSSSQAPGVLEAHVAPASPSLTRMQPGCGQGSLPPSTLHVGPVPAHFSRPWLMKTSGGLLRNSGSTSARGEVSSHTQQDRHFPPIWGTKMTLACQTPRPEQRPRGKEHPGSLPQITECTQW